MKLDDFKLDKWDKFGIGLIVIGCFIFALAEFLHSVDLFILGFVVLTIGGVMWNPLAYFWN